MILQLFLLEILAVILVLRRLLPFHLLLIYNLDVLLGLAEVGNTVGSIVLGRANLSDVFAGR